MTTIFDAKVCLPVSERGQVIQEAVTQEMIAYAKDILPKIDNVRERKKAMMRIAEQGIQLYAKKMLEAFPSLEQRTVGEKQRAFVEEQRTVAEMLINSSVTYFYVPDKFHKRIYDAINLSPNNSSAKT